MGPQDLVHPKPLPFLQVQRDPWGAPRPGNATAPGKPGWWYLGEGPAPLSSGCRRKGTWPLRSVPSCHPRAPSSVCRPVSQTQLPAASPSRLHCCQLWPSAGVSPAGPSARRVQGVPSPIRNPRPLPSFLLDTGAWTPGGRWRKPHWLAEPPPGMRLCRLKTSVPQTHLQGKMEVMHSWEGPVPAPSKKPLPRSLHRPQFWKVPRHLPAQPLTPSPPRWSCTGWGVPCNCDFKDTKLESDCPGPDHLTMGSSNLLLLLLLPGPTAPCWRRLETAPHRGSDGAGPAGDPHPTLPPALAQPQPQLCWHP